MISKDLYVLLGDINSYYPEEMLRYWGFYQKKLLWQRKIKKLFRLHITKIAFTTAVATCFLVLLVKYQGAFYGADRRSIVPHPVDIENHSTEGTPIL